MNAAMYPPIAQPTRPRPMSPSTMAQAVAGITGIPTSVGSTAKRVEPPRRPIRRGDLDGFLIRARRAARSACGTTPPQALASAVSLGHEFVEHLPCRGGAIERKHLLRTPFGQALDRGFRV